MPEMLAVGLFPVKLPTPPENIGGEHEFIETQPVLGIFVEDPVML